MPMLKHGHSSSSLGSGQSKGSWQSKGSQEAHFWLPSLLSSDSDDSEEKPHRRSPERRGPEGRGLRGSPSPVSRLRPSSCTNLSPPPMQESSSASVSASFLSRASSKQKNSAWGLRCISTPSVPGLGFEGMSPLSKVRSLMRSQSAAAMTPCASGRGRGGPRTPPEGASTWATASYAASSGGCSPASPSTPTNRNPMKPMLKKSRSQLEPSQMSGSRSLSSLFLRRSKTSSLDSTLAAMDLDCERPLVEALKSVPSEIPRRSQSRPLERSPPSSNSPPPSPPDTFFVPMPNFIGGPGETASPEAPDVEAHSGLAASSAEAADPASSSSSMPLSLQIYNEVRGTVPLQKLEELDAEGKLSLIPRNGHDVLSSLGSIGHEENNCSQPCAYWFKGICKYGVACAYCHFTHEGQKMKRLRPSKQTRMRIRRRDGFGSETGCNSSEQGLDVEVPTPMSQGHQCDSALAAGPLSLDDYQATQPPSMLSTTYARGPLFFKAGEGPCSAPGIAMPR